MGNATSALCSPSSWNNVSTVQYTDLGQVVKQGMYNTGLAQCPRKSKKLKRTKSNPKPGTPVTQGELEMLKNNDSFLPPPSLKTSRISTPKKRMSMTTSNNQESALSATTATTLLPPKSANALATGSILDNKFDVYNSQETVTSQLEPKENLDMSSSVPLSRQGTGEGNHHADINKNVYKPYVPESWPTAEVVRPFLAKCMREPTTVIIAMFYPRPTKIPVEIKYSYNKYNEETHFEASDNLYTMVPLKEGAPQPGESTQEKIIYFFRAFKTCMNSLQGFIWWNGYSICVDQRTLKRRLKVNGFESDPSQLLFETSNVEEFSVHRTSHKMEIRGQAVGAGNEAKYFKIRGPNAREVKVSKLRSDLITVHVPEFNSEAIVLPEL